MQKIEINTTQNVNIEFEIAPLRERIIAFIIDIIVMFTTISILYLSVGVAFGLNGFKYGYYVVMFPIFIFYSIGFETLNNGQSIGKLALNIKVVKTSGQEPRSSDYMMRWVFRMIDIYFSVGALASIFVSTSNKGQRLGDMAAETAVIKVKPARTLSFKDIEKINSIGNYEISYPEVRKLTEEDMLLIKNVIDRCRKYPNASHKVALKSMVESVKQVLEIDQKGLSHGDFLKTLINDYVVLTR